MMNILITGARGFIGSHVYSYLKTKDYNVKGIDEDILDRKALEPHFKDIDYVIHAAGKVKEAVNNEDYHKVNVKGTDNVIDFCMDNGCRLIHLSSVARFAPYGRSKQESQKLVEDNKELKSVILRLCPIVHKDSHLMKKGVRYSIEDLVADIDELIKSHNFNECEVINYPK